MLNFLAPSFFNSTTSIVVALNLTCYELVLSALDISLQDHSWRMSRRAGEVHGGLRLF